MRRCDFMTKASSRRYLHEGNEKKEGKKIKASKIFPRTNNKFKVKNAISSRKRIFVLSDQVEQCFIIKGRNKSKKTGPF